MKQPRISTHWIFMIIHQPSTRVDNGKVILSASIESSTPMLNYPQELWFSYPEEYAAHISTRADSFLASLLIPAMFLGEDILVEGEVSPKLVYRLPEFQFYNQKIRSDYLKIIQVNAQNQVPQAYDPKRLAVAVNFSGGIDSQFTFWSHIPRNQSISEYQVTHALHIHGFDIRLRDLSYHQFIHQRFANLCEALEIILIQVSTNVYQFSEFRIPWTLSHSCALIGIALSLGNLIKTYYKPSTEPWGYRGKYTYHGGEISDVFLSTEQTEVIHHGNPFTRKQKIEYLHQFPETYSSLRVCAIPQRARDKLNCSRCEKCRRTMILLKIKHYERDYDTFDQLPIYLNIFTWWLIAKKTIFETKRLLRFSQQEKRWLIFLFLLLLLLPGYCKDWLVNFLVNLIPKSRLYRLKTKLFPSDTYDHEGIRFFDYL